MFGTGLARLGSNRSLYFVNWDLACLRGLNSLWFYFSRIDFAPEFFKASLALVPSARLRHTSRNRPSYFLFDSRVTSGCLSHESSCIHVRNRDLNWGTLETKYEVKHRI